MIMCMCLVRCCRDLLVGQPPPEKKSKAIPGPGESSGVLRCVSQCVFVLYIGMACHWRRKMVWVI